MHPQHLFLRDWVHNLNERWSPQHLLTTYGIYIFYTLELASIVFVDFYFPSSLSLVHNIYKGEEESTAFTIYGVHSIDSQDIEYTAFSLVRWNTLYILKRDGFRSIYLWGMEYAIIPYERWSPPHLPIRVGVSNIFTREVGYIAIIHESWRPQHLPVRDGVHCIY